MLVQIQGYSYDEEKIVIKAVCVDQFIIAEDLFDESFETPELNYIFARNQGNMKYLYKILKSQRACANQKSIGGMLNNFIGVITQMPNSFLEANIEKAKEEEMPF